MDLFNGNKRLEQAIFTGMDYALWSRHDIGNPFPPFMMLFKDDQRKLVRTFSDGDPNAAFEEILKGENIIYDQIVMCCEGRVSHDGQKEDAVIVKGFDTSEPKGFLFVQRFRGIESGEAFRKLGNSALLSKDEQLPTALVERTGNKEMEAPYISGMTVTTDDNQIKRVIVLGNNNASTLANIIFDNTLNILNEREYNFSGEIEYHFVPDSLKIGEFEDFIFNQVKEQLKNNQTVIQWENEFSKELVIRFKFGNNRPAREEDLPENAISYVALSKKELLDEFNRIVSIPGARTDVTALIQMTALMKEFNDRGIALPGPDNNNQETKKWWQFWK